MNWEVVFATLLNKAAKLLEVKSIVTIAVMSVFSYLAMSGKIDGKDFMVVVMAIITFYFNYQNSKKGDVNGEG